jgi:mannosyl-3-phosphoglycerate phosphatase
MQLARCHCQGHKVLYGDSEMRQKIVVFSDLDGTLLDPVNYSFIEALPALELLRVQGVPLVLCSSKTRAEMLLYRQRLGNQHPFIAENGGGVYMPAGYFSTPIASDLTLAGYERLALGTPHGEIRRQFVALRAQTGARVRGFTDMRLEEITALTGLDTELAALARQREFDEPFVFDGPPDTGFLQAINGAGLNWTQGRIFHVMGQHDKGCAVRLLSALFARERGRMVTLGLGDGPNDLPMLQAVDHPVLVRREAGQIEASDQVAGLTITQSTGPKGWNEAVLEFLRHGHD